MCLLTAKVFLDCLAENTVMLLLHLLHDLFFEKKGEGRVRQAQEEKKKIPGKTPVRTQEESCVEISTCQTPTRLKMERKRAKVDGWVGWLVSV